MSDFTPPPPEDLIKAFIGEIDQEIDQMDDTITQMTHMLGAAKACLHGLLCSKSVLEDKLEEWSDLDSDTASAQPEQLELPLELPDNVVPFTHGAN